MCLPLLENFETNFDHDNVIFSNIYNHIVQVPTQKGEKVPHDFVVLTTYIAKLREKKKLIGW